MFLSLYPPWTRFHHTPSPTYIFTVQLKPILFLKDIVDATAPPPPPAPVISQCCSLNPAKLSLMVHGGSKLGRSKLVVYEGCILTVHGGSKLVAHGGSKLVAHGRSKLVAHGRSKQVVHGRSMLVVVAHGGSKLVVHGRSKLVAHGEAS